MQANKPFEVTLLGPDDVEAVTRMRRQSWLDTYVNEDFGVTAEWIKARFLLQMTPEKENARKERLKDPNVSAWVAKDTNGQVIGATTPYSDHDGVQHVGSLYVDKNWHGRGVGGVLMQKVIDWADPTKPIELGVVAYNKRAIAFYRKWGFEQIPTSEKLFDNMMPEIMMIRKGDKR